MDQPVNKFRHLKKQFYLAQIGYHHQRDMHLSQMNLVPAKFRWPQTALLLMQVSQILTLSACVLDSEVVIFCAYSPARRFSCFNLGIVTYLVKLMFTVLGKLLDEN